MAEINDLRCNPQLMQLSESSAMLRHFEYPTTWPIADILHEKFFITHGRLQAGDKITVCRFNSKDFNETTTRLLEVADVRVLEVKSREYVRLGLVGEVIFFEKSSGSVQRLHVARGQSGTFKLMDGEKTVETFGSKKEADDALLRIAA